MAKKPWDESNDELYGDYIEVYTGNDPSDELYGDSMAVYKSDSSYNKSGGGYYNKSNEDAPVFNLSKGNSQYTNTNSGTAWDANTDYQAIINDAVAKGDYVTAAQAEQLRNKKIQGLGLNYDTTNKYAGWLDSTDYGTVGREQMASGANWQDVLNTYNNRYNKAANTVGLEQYANDEVQQMMWQYIRDNMQQSNGQDAQALFSQWMKEYEQNNPKATYQGQYNAQIDSMLNQILNRGDFSYDASSDPLYQQYAEMYKREGDRAMRETLAEAASGAGGMNSYAITAAQQANNYYNSQLNDKIPELYQLAYQMYLQDKESMVQDLGLLQDMDAIQYSRYRDTINDYYNDKNFAYGVYQDAVNQENWQTEFNYNAMVNDRDFNYNDVWNNKEWERDQTRYDKEWERDQTRYDNEWNTNQAWKEKEWAEMQSENAYNKDIYSQETAKEEVKWLISLGITPSPELIAKSGMSEEDVAAAVETVKPTTKQSSIISGMTSPRIVYKDVSNGGGNSGSDSGNTTQEKPSLSAAQARDALFKNGTVTQTVLDAYNYWYGTDYTLESYSAGMEEMSGGTTEKPSITAAQARDALADGIVTQAVLDACNYYFGTNYTMEDFTEPVETATIQTTTPKATTEPKNNTPKKTTTPKKETPKKETPKEPDMSDYSLTNTHDTSWLRVTGLPGRYSYQEVKNMVDRGEVKEVIDHKNKTISYTAR